MSESYSFHSFPVVPTESRGDFWNAFLQLVSSEIVSRLSEEQRGYLNLGDNDDFSEPYYLGKEIAGMGEYDAGWESMNGVVLLRMVIQKNIEELFNQFPQVAEIGVSKSTQGIKSSGLVIKAFNPNRKNGKGTLHVGDAENGKTHCF